jgi:hypothetical protein
MHPRPFPVPRPRPSHRRQDQGRTGPEDPAHGHVATGGWDRTNGPTIGPGILAEQAETQKGLQRRSTTIAGKRRDALGASCGYPWLLEAPASRSSDG